jgi:D-lactate dehydrogenase (cytochrome)
VTSQLTLFGVALLGIGYFIGQASSATQTAEVLESVNTSLQPSVIGIANQEARQPVYGSLEDYKLAIRELKEKWGAKGKADKVSTDKEDLDTHGVSDWSYHEAKRPTVVVWAESTEEVQEVVLLARRYRVPITPFSGGTSLEGHFSSVSGPRRAVRPSVSAKMRNRGDEPERGELPHTSPG